MESQIIICRCHSVEHQLVLSHDSEDPPEDKSVYVYVHLNKLSLWRRIKYVLGFRSVYGAFDEFILDLDTLKKAVNNIQ